jgi:hypothetical protein
MYVSKVKCKAANFKVGLLSSGTALNDVMKQAIQSIAITECLLMFAEQLGK